MTINVAFKKVALGLKNLERVTWPDEYRNSKTGKVYAPHNEEERIFVFSDTPRYALLNGGEGAGKSVAGVVKILNRLRRGMSGIMVGPDLEHFKRSLWQEFRLWCPWNCVIEKHKYRQDESWSPPGTFNLVFHNEVGGYSSLLCGGIKEDKVTSWRGPNRSFAHFDEASVHRTPAALKVIDGRIRIPGPQNEPGQLFFTTTPEMHWLYDHFGPIKDNDPYEAFKRDSYTATVITEENKDNLEEGFVEKRAQSLTEAEARVFLKAEWEHISDVEKFVNIIWWDNCLEQLPPLGRSEPCVIGLDASKGSTNTGYIADTFAMVMVSRHPSRSGDIAIRYCGIWQPEPGQLLDYSPIEQELIRLCSEYSVIEVAYDPTQLHKMCYDLRQRGVAHFREFNQGADRLKADKGLQTLIVGRQIAHDGNPLLRQHIDNSNAKKYNDGSSNEDGIRIVKRNPSLKVDAAVALSMAAARRTYYNI